MKLDIKGVELDTRFTELDTTDPSIHKIKAFYHRIVVEDKYSLK